VENDVISLGKEVAEILKKAPNVGAMYRVLSVAKALFNEWLDSKEASESKSQSAPLAN
jgi:hypothetical protein